MIDVSRFKVVFGGKVLNAVCVNSVYWEGCPEQGKPFVPDELELYVINEDGNLSIIRDKAWKFQFLPVIQRG